MAVGSLLSDSECREWPLPARSDPETRDPTDVRRVPSLRGPMSPRRLRRAGPPWGRPGAAWAESRDPTVVRRVPTLAKNGPHDEFTQKFRRVGTLRMVVGSLLSILNAGSGTQHFPKRQTNMR